MKWFRRAKSAFALTTQLNSYPAYKAPNSGNHLALSKAEAQANFAYFLENKSARFDALSALLNNYGIDINLAQINGQHRALIKELYKWAQENWAKSVPDTVATRQAWRNTNRQGDEIIYSVVMDCGIALGEIITHHRPDFKWGLDLNPENIKEEMPSALRIVLLAPSLSHPGKTVVVDSESLAAAMLLNPQSAANRAVNLWLRSCDEAIDGSTQGEGI